MSDPEGHPGDSASKVSVQPGAENPKETAVPESGALRGDMAAPSALLEKTAETHPELLRQGRALVVRPLRRRRWPLILVLLLLAVGAGGGYYWWSLHQFHLPPGFAYGNGRLEADPIDIDTKFAGRVAQLMVDEGDRVKKGEVVARMDTRDLEATRRSYIAQKKQAEHSLDEARALVVQQQTQVKLAQQESARTQALVTKGFATQELLDQRRQILDGAVAALHAANQRVDEAEHAVAVVTHNIELYDVNIADDTLIAPKDGRIEYRVSNVGEVLPAGGKVFTMLDLSYVYMDIYLPTLDAGRAAIGDEARIVLDAFPQIAIPARVTYIATEAQFTPKAVETRYERDRLMFRIRARIDQDILKQYATQIRTGLPGVAYVRLDPEANWPRQLRHEGMP